MAPGSPAGLDAVYLEVGPGRSLGTFAARSARAAALTPAVLASLPAASEPGTGTETMLTSLGLALGARRTG